MVVFGQGVSTQLLAIFKTDSIRCGVKRVKKTGALYLFIKYDPRFNGSLWFWLYKTVFSQMQTQNVVAANCERVS